MKLRVLSIDYDGCLANRYYYKSSNRCIIEHNKPLFSSIIDSSSGFSNTTIFIGSNRQSFPHDDNASSITGSGYCFHQIGYVFNHLYKSLSKIKFDPFLLADIYGDLESGESFKRFEKFFYSKEQVEHSYYLFDEQKITLIYAQLHKYANEHPDDEIVFEFYDDRKDILEALQSFFASNSDLLPNNMILILNQYAGKNVEHLYTLKGTGIIDRDFRSTVKKIGVLSTLELPENLRFTFDIKGTSEKYFTQNFRIYPLNLVTAEKIQNFSNRNTLIKNNSSYDIVEVDSEVYTDSDSEETQNENSSTNSFKARPR